MKKIIDSNANVIKLSILFITIISCVLLAIIVNYINNIDIVYTHLFYLPIVLTGIWYERKSLFVAFGLGVLHVYLNFLLTNQMTYIPLMRAFMFLLVAYVIGNLSAKNNFLFKKIHKMNLAMIDIVMEVSAEGIIGFCSPSCESILGYTSSELEGRCLIDLVTEQDKQRLKKEFESAVKNSCQMRIDFIAERKDGTQIWIESVASPVYNDMNRFEMYVFGSRDISERKIMEEKLKFMSLHDPMTKLYNRTYFEDAIKRYESNRFDPIGIIVADIDGLKAINDTYGHMVGDMAIVAAAEVLTSKFRNSDIIARIGGDEFVVFFPNCSQEGWNHIMSRIDEKICKVIQEKINVSISFGYSYRVDSNRSLVELFKEADDRMYEQKKTRC